MNIEIKNFLTNQLQENKSVFLQMKDLHPLLEQFRGDIQTLSVEENANTFYKELELNIREWWTNPEKGIDTGAELFAILFEYSDIFQLSAAPDADAFGINELKEPINFQVEPYSILGHYDFSEGFYAVPGVTMNCFKPIQKLDYGNIDDKYEDVEVYSLEGYTELMSIFMYHAYLALHNALQRLYDHGKLSGIKKKDPFYFLIGEHDAEIQPLFIIAGIGE